MSTNKIEVSFQSNFIFFQKVLCGKKSALSSKRVGSEQSIAQFLKQKQSSTSKTVLYRRFAKLECYKFRSRTNLQKKNKMRLFFVFAQKLIGPVLIESSSNSTMPTYPEHLLTPSELEDMVHFSQGVPVKKTQNRDFPYVVTLPHQGKFP